MHNIAVIKVSIADVKQLQAISRQTFFESYSDRNTAENMQKYLTEVFSIEKLSEELNNPCSEFYLANLNAQTIGYLKVNYGNAQTELKDPNAFEIERIYVLKEFQGKQVGQLLFGKALQLAKDRKSTYLWLGVWENNFKAISFYKKCGMMEFDTHVFILGEDKQTDILMKLEL
jgi:ribosomal protein S18 acetylase RimI-like enzyme